MEKPEDIRKIKEMEIKAKAKKIAEVMYEPENWEKYLKFAAEQINWKREAIHSAKYKAEWKRDPENWEKFLEDAANRYGLSSKDILNLS